VSQSTRIAVFADFDDTLTIQNAAHFLLQWFAPEAMKKYSGMYRSGEITFREYQERSFDAVTASVAEMQAVVATEIQLREGLRELLNAVSQAGGTFTVVSAGLDFYIEPVLEANGLQDLPVICGTAARDAAEGASFRYDYPFQNAQNEFCRGDWATCKCRAIIEAGAGVTKVFVGDGSTSDSCVAPKADYVFARDRLLKICADGGINATPFEDFYPVAEFVRKFTATSRESSTEPR
jgi:2-hydroxy-3-keto-5-methylthiopentenyl-1-phosphate phosphatase